MSIQNDIAAELNKAQQNLGLEPAGYTIDWMHEHLSECGAKSDLLSIVGGYVDTMPDEWGVGQSASMESR